MMVRKCLWSLLAVVAGVSLIPEDAQAAIRWSSSGIGCQPEASIGQWDYQFDQLRGLLLVDSTPSGDDNFLSIVCAVPTGPALVELRNTNSVELLQVGLRAQFFGGTETVHGFLTAHAYGHSANSCDCDADTVNPTDQAHFGMSLAFAGDGDGLSCKTACFGGLVSSSWVLTVKLVTQDVNPGAQNALLLKSLHASDT